MCLAFYLIGMWYKRSEAQKRYSFFFNSTTLAGAFGGLLAAAIGNMDGLRGYKGWRWIFIIEGAITVFVSFFIYFLLPDFPEGMYPVLVQAAHDHDVQFRAYGITIDDFSVCFPGLGRWSVTFC